MLQLFDTYASLFKSWRVVRYEQEGETYMLQLSAILQDDSRLELPLPTAVANMLTIGWRPMVPCGGAGIMHPTGPALLPLLITYICQARRCRNHPPLQIWKTCYVSLKAGSKRESIWIMKQLMILSAQQEQLWPMCRGCLRHK